MLNVVCVHIRQKKEKRNDDEVDMAGWREKLEVQRQLTKKVQISIRQSTRFSHERTDRPKKKKKKKKTTTKDEEAGSGEWKIILSDKHAIWNDRLTTFHLQRTVEI